MTSIEASNPMTSPSDNDVTANDVTTSNGNVTMETYDNTIAIDGNQDSTDAESDSSVTTGISNVGKKDGDKSTVDMKVLMEKLETLREKYYSVLGERFTCYKIRLFVLIYIAVIVFLSCISSYLFTVSDHIMHRYRFSDFEMDFVHGADKITLVCTLLFVSYYGNKMIKPVAIMSGALIYSFGALLCAVPYWVLGTRDSYKLDRIQTYLDSGLCQSGNALTNVTQTGSTGTTTTRNPETFTEQCDYALSADNGGAYTILCIAQLIMGFGKAFVIPIGLTYIEEAERRTSTPLFVGK